MSAIDFETVVPKLDAILARGLSQGVGERDGQMCIEAAVCAAMGLPHGDNPECVAASVRSFKIRLNDSTQWPSPAARAQGLRRLGVGQLGSRGVVDDIEFAAKLAERMIRVLIPRLFSAVLGASPECVAAADRCEREGTKGAAYAAADAADAANAACTACTARAANAAARAATNAANVAANAAAYATDAAAYATDAAAYATDAAAYAAADAADAAADASYLTLAADLAFGVLVEFKSPGALWLLEQENKQP